MLQAFNHVKAASQEAVAHGVEMMSTVVDSATKASELAFGTAKETADGFVSGVKGFEGWTPDASWTNPAELAAPVAGKLSKFGKAQLKLSAETADTLSAQSHAAAKTLSKRSEAFIDEATASMPQAEPMVKNMKAAMAQGFAFYEQAFGVAKQMQSQMFAAGDQFFAQMDKSPMAEVVAMPKRKRV
jgi:hypothetical protein